jgi:hypothetical protein
MGMAVDAAHQQPYDPVAALTKYLNQRNNPPHDSRRNRSLQPKEGPTEE